MNKTIDKGSRILVTGWTTHSIRERIYYDCHAHNLPNPPRMGVYEVEEYPYKTSREMRRSEFDELKKNWDERGIKYEITRVRENAYTVNYEDKYLPDGYFNHNPNYVPIMEDMVTVKSTFFLENLMITYQVLIFLKIIILSIPGVR